LTSFAPRQILARMLPDADGMALRAAMDFFKAQQPLAAALVYAEAAQGGASAPGLWCGLGSSLMRCRGVLVRRPFEIWAAKVFRRGEPTFPGSPYAEIARDWLRELPEAGREAPLRDEELPAMIEFLLINERVLPEAAAALPQDDRMGVVMALGDRRAPLYVPLLRDAIEGRLGDGAARSALKRVGAFLERPDVQASLLAAARSPSRDELEPYLKFVLDRLPPGWDQPRAGACPPYEGIGRIDVELLSVTQPAAAARALSGCLGASERDARSWVDFAPCVVKRGAMRDDALRLKTALGSLAELKLHNFTWSHQVDPPEVEPAKDEPAKKPWWRFW
jgi:hypothetical protein